MTGYEALRQGAAWADLTGRGVFRVRGPDRVRWLHAMVTNHIAQLASGEGCYAFLLDAQGRILADANILCLPDSFLLDLEPETRERIGAHLDRHIIADDVTLTDVSQEMAILAVEGPRSAAVLQSLGIPVPASAFAHREWGDVLVARLSATGLEGYRFFLPRNQRDALAARLEGAGVPGAGPGALRIVRLEQGRPRYGEDITAERLPHETQLLHAIHFSKGCYIGQEIVERIRARGQVHRLLVRLLIEGGEPPPAGAAIVTQGKQVGEITSAAWSPAQRAIVALGYVRMAEAGTGELTVEGRRARILADPPA
ncbi:MAG: glycine cleavage T C-terminal barrel domain-containing protein [Bryobacterales bacterium]|nr:hypothetical protein [Bryobacteraceae bacterium]MDW8128938.1 glycine cleavage T C-terminal barrel domain-containing protein [Bryobacterales bacterium]